MFGIRELLGLSDEGYLDFKRGVRACVLTNLSLLLPFAVIVQATVTLLDPLMGGGALDAGRLWALFAAGVISAILYFCAYLNEYSKTYTVAYSESERIRLGVAEHIRRLPLSFFNDKNLSELTANMMADCASVEHTMSHVAPGLFAGIFTAALTCLLLGLYDWRMSLALFAPLPLSFGLIAVTKKTQARFGEKLVAAKLNVSEQAQEYLEGIKVIKAFGMGGRSRRRWEAPCAA
jgi:ATP-binding cassette subfamily B protein